MRVLLVEDEEKISAAIAHTLKLKHYEVDCVGDGNEGLILAQNDIYDVIVLDVMLPGKSGLNILKELRDRGNMAPILLLTALDSVNDRVSGLELGADDYLSKPFSMAELMARIGALARRVPMGYVSNILDLGNMHLNTNNLTLIVNEEEIALTDREAQLMEMLMRKPGAVFSREKIIDRVWGYDNSANNNNIEVYIHHLRKKISKADYKIATVRGIGYTLKVR
jgi:Response regulators consisting of a CheY-like receiver domain and a winged-helix DNA-binding domain